MKDGRTGKFLGSSAFRMFLATGMTCLILCTQFSRPVPALAQRDQPYQSILTISPIEESPTGMRVPVKAVLVNTAGNPIPNKPVIFFLDGERVRRQRTDENGEAAISLPTNLLVGTYRLEAAFEGTKAYAASMDSQLITIRPIYLTIETVPPLPNLPFQVNDYYYTTDQNGLIRIEAAKPGTVEIRAGVPDPEPESFGGVVRFERWGDEEFSSVRTIEISKDRHLQAGFSISYWITPAFVDLDGDLVDPSQIDEISIKSSTGAVLRMNEIEPQLYQSYRVVRRMSGLEVSPLQYSIESVMINGANVVNRYQQRYLAQGDSHWEVELLLYYLRIRAKDAILGFPVGTYITVQYPNGSTEYLLFEGNHEVFVGPLARGLYKVKVGGVQGITPNTPVALSRDQDVTFKVVTMLDLSLGFGAGLIFAFGLLFIGRPKLLGLPGLAVKAVKFRRVKL